MCVCVRERKTFRQLRHGLRYGALGADPKKFYFRNSLAVQQLALDAPTTGGMPSNPSELRSCKLLKATPPKKAVYLA